jgi:phytoene desaturase
MGSNSKGRIGVIGAGPGGLAAGLVLQSHGYEVHILESQDQVGGRNARLTLQDQFHFDIGPTFFLMPEVLEEILRLSHATLSDCVELKRLDPMYDLYFPDGQTLRVSSNPHEMSKAIAKFSRGDADRFWSFRNRQEKKFRAMLPVLQKPFSGLSDLLGQYKALQALPFLNTRSVYDELSDYFESEQVRLAFTFQAKYLGMSPFDCPSLFTILPHIEHSMGVWHPVGGCNALSRGMARIFEARGGTLRLNSPVKKVLTKGRKVIGLMTDDRGEESFDHVIMNADFAYGMSQLFSNESRQRWKDERLNSMKYSCSTFMLYLGLRGEVNFPHHGIHFAQNYRKNIRELTSTFELSDDPSFYIHNPSKLDPSLAPPGYSSLYVLVPVPNLNASIDWETQATPFRNKIIDLIEQRTGQEIRSKIVAEKVISPLNWSQDYNVFKGAVFSMAHSWDQMLFARPHNESEEFENLFIVGGGTHPGSGLPTILQSGLIAAQLIEQKSPLSWIPKLPWFSKKNQLETARL